VVLAKREDTVKADSFKLARARGLAYRAPLYPSFFVALWRSRMSWVKSMVGASLMAAGLVIAGCGVDLGACDQTLLGGVEGMTPHTAQQLVNRTCAGGLCHSQDAVGALRNGAPAGLDFDLIPASASVQDSAKVLRSSAVVREWRDEMWDQLGSGDMPPEGFGTLSSDDKETVRNWLACGAPVVVAPPAGTTPDWTSIYALFEERCLACHTAERSTNGGGFVLGAMGGACAALGNVVNAAAITERCVGNGTLVVPGDPDASLLLDKLSAPTPRCGERMPLGMDPLSAAELAAIRSWIQAGAQPPEGCP
jgi:mono/diheme cytochrome c family protein